MTKIWGLLSLHSNVKTTTTTSGELDVTRRLPTQWGGCYRKCLVVLSTIWVAACLIAHRECILPPSVSATMPCWYLHEHFDANNNRGAPATSVNKSRAKLNIWTTLTVTCFNDSRVEKNKQQASPRSNSSTVNSSRHDKKMKGEKWWVPSQQRTW